MSAGSDWTPKLKGYAHFDAPISEAAAKRIATDAKYVMHHKFLPFLSYSSKSKKFNSHKIKERVIRYGARKDAYIYSYYRYLLMIEYEKQLADLKLGECVIAYRKIPVIENGKLVGKSNINFAYEAFEKIKEYKNCVAITLDVSSFFESLDHNLIKEKWCRILGVTRLPDDHFKVFRSITDYRTVDAVSCYERLELLKLTRVSGKIKKIYKYSRKKQPKQLCSDMNEFREKIAGTNGLHTSLISKNPYTDPHADMKHWGKTNSIEKRGIPQGSPISDVIANLYLLDFDLKLKEFVEKLGGTYRRYSDDILLIVPWDISEASSIIEFVKSSIREEGNFIKISDGKTIITEFSQLAGKVKYTSRDHNHNIVRKQFEYLGFAFDGTNVFLKSQTLSRYYKRMINGVRSAVYDAFEDAKSAGSMETKHFLNEAEIYHRFSRANKNRKDKKGKKARNFMSYAIRASEVMKSVAIKSQLRNHRKIIKKAIDFEVSKVK